MKNCATCYPSGLRLYHHRHPTLALLADRIGFDRCPTHLVCVTPEFYSVKGLERLGQFMGSIGQRHPLNVLGVILSFWNTRGKSNQAFLEVIERTFPSKAFQSKIRRDISVSEASIYGKPVFETRSG